MRSSPVRCALAASLLLASCEKQAPAPSAASAKPSASFRGNLGLQIPTATARAQRPPPKRDKRKIVAKPVASVKPSDDDPRKGVWDLEDALAGLPKGKHVVAAIETDFGTIECKLFHDKAPITVASFVGLARGTRPWKDPIGGEWVTRPAYDGTVFHRIVKGFMIQGGDPKKNGTGEAGFVIPDEIWEDANHDRAGLLCMANRGKNTNSAQFFITDGEALHLDGGYTIFGECRPLEVIHAIASVEVVGERPKTPPVIRRVTITRTDRDPLAPRTEAAPASSPALSASASARSAAAGASSTSTGPAPKSGAPATSAKPAP